MELEIKGLDWAIEPSDEIAEVLQNVKTILATAKGTVPYDRELGLSVEVLDEPINNETVLIAEAAQQIRRFEPRARLVGMKIEEANSDGRLAPRFQVEIVRERLRGGLR